ncbi:hypothetical protein GCM10007860_15070 [Chitiniphilus shinanonensis]|uniref:L,D-TPase catalytic domain-containing protein n=1 Tax=Chitiniphilus shinanonensis TaxID=553088 RepID=A0ABQ6BQR1_9NEIS|nr:L,D-transpeptidase family protein [Chitiniphilus shinanonensis]GLS04360.1 hypothetical protein GCM10007860_15070 [Chitiniphilus shinanonensis]
MPWAKFGLCLVLLLFFTPAAQPRLTPPWPQTHVPVFEQPGKVFAGSPEEMIVAAIDAVRQGRMADARATIDALLVKEPNYNLAHLVSADLYAMRAAPLASLGGAAVDAPRDRLDDLKREAQVRLLHHLAPPPAERMLPAQLLVLSPGQEHAVVVDSSAARAYLFKNVDGVPTYVTDYYVTIGKLGTDKTREGDQRTPLGVYFVTSHMTRPQLDKIYGEAASLYGVGAWPLSYPNELDRREGRTGHGIWLHGVPYDTYSRAPQASNGCVALTNEDMTALARQLAPGSTPVVNVTRIEWLDRASWDARRAQALARLEAWRGAWESLDTQRYLSFYGNRFTDQDGQNLAGWQKQKAAVNAGRSWTKITLDKVSIFATSGENATWVATFDQDYRSDALDNRMRKRLYWQEENGAWKIQWEGRARAG